MKFLELAELDLFNTIMGSVVTPDGTRLQSRLEAYTCKNAGNDKKLLKALEFRFGHGKSKSSTKGESSDDNTEINETPKKSASGTYIENNSVPASPSPSPAISSNGLNLKTFSYLISTMNNMFPDYDFSDIPPESFVYHPSLANCINHANTSIFNTGLDNNTSTFNEFSRRMWDCMDSAIGGLKDCEIYSFSPEYYEIDDPFRERGTIWSLNYFFYNKKLKRLLCFNVKADNELTTIDNFDELSQRSGSITPLPN